MVRGRAVVLLAILGTLAAACRTESDVPAVGPSPAGSPRVIVIEPGDRVTFAPDEVDVGDVIECRGKGGVTVPEPGVGVGSSAGVEAETREDGSVVATCEPGPPGNA